MHPRIQELYNLIKGISPEKILHNEVLYILKDYGASRTEASIALHLGFNIEPSKVDDFVITSQIWPHEDPNDVFFQTMKYLYYDSKDKNYDSDDDKVSISI
jgi:hypothetical protein